METSDRWALRPLELACGLPLGFEPEDQLDDPPADQDPYTALERAVLPALARPPCLVSFSGGRDSSAVLAVATDVARKRDLPLPVPITLRFPQAPASDEASWQERVVRYLNLEDWIRLEFEDELDLVGPIAAGLLHRHGVLWPPNSHFHLPILEKAKGGSVLTGIDGDGLFGSWKWLRVADILSRRARPIPRDILRIGLALSPPAVRRVYRRQTSGPPNMPWLRPDVLSRLAQVFIEEGSDEPVRWDRRVHWWARLRSVRMAIHSFELMAADADVQAVHPLSAPSFLNALSRAGGRWGFGDRTAIMERLFATVLPTDVLRRDSKATMDEPFWNRHTRAFVDIWNGEGVDQALVDCTRLRKEWSSEVPLAPSSCLLQAAWLSCRSYEP